MPEKFDAPRIITELLRLEGPTYRDLSAKVKEWLAKSALQRHRVSHQELHRWHTGIHRPNTRSETLLKAFYTYAQMQRQRRLAKTIENEFPVAEDETPTAQD